MALRVRVWDGQFEELDEPFEVDFVSQVNNGTHGPPALVAPNPKSPTSKRAKPGEVVLFVNHNAIGMYTIEEIPAR